MRLRWLPAAFALLAFLPDGQAQEPVQVEARIHLLSVGDYNPAQGTYLLDFYLNLRWDGGAAPANFTPDRFEFMNGRATSRELLVDEDAPDGARELWYRIQARLYSQPDLRAYPFDRQVLTVLLEDTVHPATQLVYVPGPLTVDPDVQLAGWRVGDKEASAAGKDYPFGESYSRLRAALHIGREPVSSAMRSFLPPLAFILVASFSFFYGREQAANRLGLGTGMLITAVGFHISQTVSLPPLGGLTFFDKVMISVYAFIAGTLLVTTALAFGERVRLPERASALLNRRGALVAAALPILVFLLLQLV